MKKLIIILLSLGIGSINAQQKRPFLPRPPLPEKPEIVKDLFGQWLDKDGYVTDGPKIKNWVDSDRDRVDDRFQAGPGKPAGKKRPEVEKPKPKPKPKPRPTKPVKPNKPTGDKEKPAKPEKPSRPVHPELSEELKTKLDSYKKEKDQLTKELKETIKKLEKPTRQKVKETIEAFHKNNKDRFDDNKELGKAIKEGLIQNRPERPKKPEVSVEVKKLHKSHADKIKELHESKKKLMTSLKDVKGDERKKLLDGFRQEQKSLHDELKSIQKQLREQIVICTLPKDNKPTKERPDRRPPPRPESKEKNTESRRPAGR
jgi:gas vesicle protein